MLKVNTSVRKLLSTIEAHLVSSARNREWTAHVAMPAAEEPLEDGLYSKFHNLLPWQFVLRFRTPSCMRTLALWVNENSSACRKTSEELPVYLLLGAITLASLLRPRGAERVEYEGIRYSQRWDL